MRQEGGTPKRSSGLGAAAVSEAPSHQGLGRAAQSLQGLWPLFVTGIHEEAQEEDIMDVFSEFGETSGIHLNVDKRSGLLKGYAIIGYSTREEAELAIQGMNGKKVLGQSVHVTWCYSRGPSGGKRKR